MNSEYLFTKLTGKNKGEPLDADSVYSMLKRLSKKTDINSHPHQLRHYFAEERRKEGWDLNDIRYRQSGIDQTDNRTGCFLDKPFP